MVILSTLVCLLEAKHMLYIPSFMLKYSAARLIHDTRRRQQTRSTLPH